MTGKKNPRRRGRGNEVFAESCARAQLLLQRGEKLPSATSAAEAAGFAAARAIVDGEMAIDIQRAAAAAARAWGKK